MTRDEAREFAKIVQAYVDGKTIQFHMDDGKWSDLDDPDFYSRTIEYYRIKPETREFWVTLCCDGEVWQCDTTLTDAQRQCNERNAHGKRSPYTIVHVREVTE